jgi:pyruvate dehydrogenase E1 component alpha subunit
MMAELYGKVTGCCHGKAGSMHLVDADQGMMGASALVAGTIPIATGSALAFSLAPETSDGTPEEPRVSVAFFGDGATEEGIFYESLGFAQLRRLPVIFVCENNLYATYSHQSARQATPFISQRGSSFGIPGHVVDGNDIAEIYKVAGHAVSRARRGDGPSLLEFRTTRWRDHVGPDLDVHVGFRTAEEVESAMRQCAILKAEKRLIENGWLMEDERQEFEHALAREIEDAFTFARAGAFPDGEEIFTDVYEISRGGMKNENTANT